MAAFMTGLLVLAAVAMTAAQAPEPPLSDTRLTVHTLLREDVFAGFLANDMNRFARAVCSRLTWKSRIHTSGAPLCTRTLFTVWYSNSR